MRWHAWQGAHLVDWSVWWAWYPVRVRDGDAVRWVWREPVERKIYYATSEAETRVYRLPGDTRHGLHSGRVWHLVGE
jgi:hypothetical protein